MAENGEEKLLAVARHIVKNLGHTDTMADDILQFFSKFDDRFSGDKLSQVKLSENGPRSSAALEKSLTFLTRQISQYLAVEHPIWSDSADSSTFLDAVDDLLSVLRDWTPMSADKAVSACLEKADDLLQRAMFRLADEFKVLMERGGESFDLTTGGDDHDKTGRDYSFESEDEDLEYDENDIPIAHPVSNFDILIDALPPGTINDLHEIVKRMVVAGFWKECSSVYGLCRREFLEESLSRLSLKKFSSEEVQKMAWPDLEDEIDRWIKGANVALKILFPSERKLCDRVFLGYPSPANRSFMEVCIESVMQLLHFADAIAIGNPSPERLFKVLDVYETLRDLMPDFEALFSDQYSVLLRNKAIAIWRRLGKVIRGIFMELENLISRDPAKTPVPGGGLHPITRYVMNYLRAASRSRQSLEQVFDEGIDYSKVEETASSTSLSIQISWVMELLERNLEMKSKLYKDPALCSVFMMNNEMYIVQKVRDSDLVSLLGEDWIRKHTAKSRQYIINYQRSSWSKILSTLKLDNPPISTSVASKSMKEKLRLFHMYFEEACKIQSSWVIFDDQVREELRASVAEALASAYGNFIARFQSLPEVGKQADRLIRYGVEDVEAMINDQLFCSGSSAGRK